MGVGPIMDYRCTQPYKILESRNVSNLHPPLRVQVAYAPGFWEPQVFWLRGSRRNPTTKNQRPNITKPNPYPTLTPNDSINDPKTLNGSTAAGSIILLCPLTAPP